MKKRPDHVQPPRLKLNFDYFSRELYLSSRRNKAFLINYKFDRVLAFDLQTFQQNGQTAIPKLENKRALHVLPISQTGDFLVVYGSYQSYDLGIFTDMGVLKFYQELPFVVRAPYFAYELIEIITGTDKIVLIDGHKSALVVLHIEPDTKNYDLQVIKGALPDLVLCDRLIANRYILCSPEGDYKICLFDLNTLEFSDPITIYSGCRKFYYSQKYDRLLISCYGTLMEFRNVSAHGANYQLAYCRQYTQGRIVEILACKDDIIDCLCITDRNKKFRLVRLWPHRLWSCYGEFSCYHRNIDWYALDLDGDEKYLFTKIRRNRNNTRFYIVHYSELEEGNYASDSNPDQSNQ
jgi:hypothetical protein